jgi:hypothetical protein
MAFKLLPPIRGQKPAYESGVTVSYRSTPSKGFHLSFCLGKDVAQELGFVARDSADLLMDDTYGLALIVPNKAGGGGARGVACRGDSATISIRAPWMIKHTEEHPAEKVRYRMAHGGVEIFLPAWAYMPGQRPPPVPSPDAFRQQTTLNVVSEDAAPPTPRDELEAKCKLRNGALVTRVAREFGQTNETVQRWYDEVMAEVREGNRRRRPA